VDKLRIVLERERQASIRPEQQRKTWTMEDYCHFLAHKKPEIAPPRDYRGRRPSRRQET
jgi:hypothetical protein